MQAVTIDNKLNLCNKLFFGQVFDEFLFLEGNITTNCSFSMDGRLQKAYYTLEEYDSISDPKLATWRDIKPLFAAIIGGNLTEKFPIRFNITFTLSGAQTDKLVTAAETDISPESVEGLHINIKYENSVLTCITATSLKIFTMDKSLEHYFDKYTANFLNRF